jgi:hypothetical protein
MSLALAAGGCGDDDEDVIIRFDGGADAAIGDGGADAGGGADAPGADASTSGDAGAGDAGGGRDGGGDAATTTASLRVVHAAPGAPAVDVYARGVGAPLVTNLAYGQASAYAQVPPGTYDIDVRPAGAVGTTAPIFSATGVMVGAGRRYSVFAAGQIGAAADRTFRLLPLEETFGAPAANAVRVRILHAAPDAPTVAIDVGNDGTPEIAMLARFAATDGAGIDLPAGMPLRIGIWAGSPLARVTSFSVPALPAGAQAFVVAAGLLGRPAREADAFSLWAVLPVNVATVRQDPALFALHASPDAPAVDLFVGAAQVAENVAFGALAGPLLVPPGTYTIDVFPTAAGAARPAGAPAVSAMTGMLEAGDRALAVATGYVTPPAPPAGGAPRPLQVLLLREGFTADAANARLRFVHAAPDAPAVDVGPATGMTLTPVPGLPSLPYGMATAAEGVGIAPGPVTIGIAAAGTTNTVARFQAMPRAGQRAFAVVAGALMPAAGQQGLRLLLVDASTTPWMVTPVAALP